MRHSAARASTAAVLVDSSAMSGFKEHIQGVRADVARRRNERRGEPPVEFRLRPVPTARRLWANAMGGRLGIGSDGNRVALVTLRADDAQLSPEALETEWKAAAKAAGQDKKKSARWRMVCQQVIFRCRILASIHEKQMDQINTELEIFGKTEEIRNLYLRLQEVERKARDILKNYELQLLEQLGDSTASAAQPS